MNCDDESISTSEMSVNFYGRTWQTIPEDTIFILANVRTLNLICSFKLHTSAKWTRMVNFYIFYLRPLAGQE
jgi:hypothetical protein